MSATTDRNITAANAIYMLSVTTIFPTPIPLVGFAADAAFDTDVSEPSEVIKGVDGRMSAGFVPYMTRQTIHIQADSPSADIFETWLDAQKNDRNIYYANAIVTLRSTGRRYVHKKGVLQSWPPVTSARRTLQPRQAVIVWDDISAEPIS